MRGVVFRDSTDDGVEGSIFETDETSTDELAAESRRVADRLDFLSTVASLWKQMAVSPAFRAVVELDADSPELAQRAAAIRRWIEQAEANRAALTELLAAVRDYRIPLPSADHDALVEYDRRRMTKESLLERAIATSVDMAGAARLLAATLDARRGPAAAPPMTSSGRSSPCLLRCCSAIAAAAASLCPPLRTMLAKQPLLYVPLAKGGSPTRSSPSACGSMRCKICSPGCRGSGLWVETCELLEVARADGARASGRAGRGDRVRRAVQNRLPRDRRKPRRLGRRAGLTNRTGEEIATDALVSCLEKLTESLLQGWLGHSRTLRLSVLERIHDRATWKKTVAFIEQLRRRDFHAAVFEPGQHPGHFASRRGPLADEPAGGAARRRAAEAARRPGGRHRRWTRRRSNWAWCWKRSSRTTANIATTTAPRRSPTAASCSTCCSIFCDCDRATTASAGT